jgi:CRISPR/Cas system-associated exonuclease Cas4 (RecB family)
MREILTVSASSLSTFFRCSQQYKWQFLEEKQPDEGGAAVFTIYGSTFHKALELHFKFGLGFEEIKNSWRSLLISFFTEAKGLEFPNKKELDDCFVKGYVQLDNVQKMKERWKDYKILDVEKYFRLKYENKYMDNVYLSGRIDLLLGNDESIVSLDWKTSKSKETNIDENVQLTFYSYFVKCLYKSSLESIFGVLAYPIDGELIFTQRTDLDFTKLFEKVDNMLERIKREDFAKEPKKEMRLGDCFFCQYKRTCNLT